MVFYPSTLCALFGDVINENLFLFETSWLRIIIITAEQVQADRIPLERPYPWTLRPLFNYCIARIVEGSSLAKDESSHFGHPGAL